MPWLSPTHSFDLNSTSVNKQTNKRREKGKKNPSHTREEADNKGRQTGRREWQNLIKFNKAERTAQALNSDPPPPFFFFFYNFWLLKPFYALPFYLCLHSLTEEQPDSEGDAHFIFPWMLTEDGHHLCKLACISGHDYQTGLHFSDAPHMAIYRPPRSALPLFKLLSLLS